jgi:CheY-like chemotaxis protein
MKEPVIWQKDSNMNTKPRVLVVEDDKTARETWVAVLKREGFVAHGAESVEEAKIAANRCSYHVAVIDIMLNGDDTSNRDGVEVVRYLRWLREDTQPLVLSGQDDTALVRDLLREYGAIDYIAKKQIEEAGKGNILLVQKIKSYLTPQIGSSNFADWQILNKTLTGGLPEDVFVSECLRSLTFKGGFENLRASLETACKHLVPLLPEANAQTPYLSRRRHEAVLNGVFWSKAQCAAVEIVMHGTNISDELLEKEWDLSLQSTLYNRNKAGLAIVVFQRSDLAREHFGSAIT